MSAVIRDPRNEVLNEIITKLEDIKENGIPEEIYEMINMDEWYEAWNLAFDKAIELVKKY